MGECGVHKTHCQRAHDVTTTSLLRQNDVATSFDVIMTLLSRHVSAGFVNVTMQLHIVRPNSSM